MNESGKKVDIGSEPGSNSCANGRADHSEFTQLRAEASCHCVDDDTEKESSVISGINQERIRKAVREILVAVGEDPDREGLLDTPARVARMYAEIFSGLHIDPSKHLKKTFTQKHDEMVLIKDIEFASCCEHHLLPFLGRAHIAYLPDGKVVGLSKIARVVEAIARKPQVQERMTEDLAELIMTELQPRGVAVIVEAEHTCMTIRGVRKPGAMTITSAMRGLFKTNPMTRGEFMSLVFGAKK